MRIRISTLIGLLIFSAVTAAKPNVLIFFIDDLGYADLGCYGSTFYETPSLDRLASRGVRFTDGYSAHPVCSPTRAALMTGKTPHRMGIDTWIQPTTNIHLPLDEITLGQAFEEAGYKTGYAGKWHLGKKHAFMPQSRGFQWTKAVNEAGAPSSYYFPYKKGGSKAKKLGTYGDVHDVPDLEAYAEGDYLTDVITTEVIKFIETSVVSEKPFFLCFGHYALHTPIQPPLDLVSKYENKAKAQYDGSDTLMLDNRRYDTHSRGRQDNPAYAAMIENLDTNIGRVLDCLKEQGVEEETIVVFCSDNGGLCTRSVGKRGKTGKSQVGPTSNLMLRAGKGWNYEGGIRTPLMISWPGRIEAAVSDEPVITMDLYPTLLDLAGLPLKPQQHLDGVSLKPLLGGKSLKAGKKRFLAWTFPHGHGSGHRPSHALRKGDWKLIYFIEDDEVELYNLSEDLAETKDLSAENPEKVGQLKEQLDEWLKLGNPNPGENG